MKDCNNKEKGLKCFKCNNFGHIAINCPEGKSNTQSETETKNDKVCGSRGQNMHVNEHKSIKHMYKNMSINDDTARVNQGGTLIDVGSVVNFTIFPLQRLFFIQGIDFGVGIPVF